MTIRRYVSPAEQSYDEAASHVRLYGGSVKFDTDTRRYHRVPPPTPAARRARLAQLSADEHADGVKTAAAKARDLSAVVFAAGGPVQVQRRRTPRERLAEIDREMLWRS